MAVMTEHGDGSSAATRPSGTVTFLFTDVEGSTKLWAADKDAMSASLLVHDSVLRAAIEGNGGYVFTTAGDSFAAAFARASDAVRAATESQIQEKIISSQHKQIIIPWLLFCVSCSRFRCR